MHIIVVGAGITGIACAHAFLNHGHTVTLIESASSPNQGCSFGMAGFMGPLSVPMLCSPFKGKAGLASVFAKTRRLSWDVSISQMRFLRALATARSYENWKADQKNLIELARYSVGLTEFTARLHDLSYEQIHGLLKVFTNDRSWEEAHRDEETFKAGEWVDGEGAIKIDPGLESVPKPLFGAYYIPQELSGNGSYFSKQLQALNLAHKNLTMLYHTNVQSLLVENDAVKGVVTEKGNIQADAVVLSNNLGAESLIEPHFKLPLQRLTGWTITAKIEPMNTPVYHTIIFENRDIMVTRLGNRLRVSGMYWLGNATHDMGEKVIEELYEGVCKLLPGAASWRETSNWQGQTLIHPDSLPSCGKTKLNGLYLNIAHGLNGWSLASGCAEILENLISGTQCPINVEPYSPLRFER